MLCCLCTLVNLHFAALSIVNGKKKHLGYRDQLKHILILVSQLNLSILNSRKWSCSGSVIYTVASSRSCADCVCSSLPSRDSWIASRDVISITIFQICSDSRVVVTSMSAFLWSGSIYEPLKLSILHRDDEPLWEKLDRFYSAGENLCPACNLFFI